jgi:hypothetical protein
MQRPAAAGEYVDYNDHNNGELDDDCDDDHDVDDNDHNYDVKLELRRVVSGRVHSAAATRSRLRSNPVQELPRPP